MSSYLLSSHGIQSFLLPLCYIREIIQPSLYQKEDLPSSFFSARIEYRGQTVPVLDRSVLTQEQGPGEENKSPSCRYMILFTLYGRLVGIPTEKSGRIMHIPDNELIPPPTFLSAQHGVLACWTEETGLVHPLLDIHDLVRRQVSASNAAPSSSLHLPRVVIFTSLSDKAALSVYEKELGKFIQSAEWMDPDQLSMGHTQNDSLRLIGIHSLGPNALAGNTLPQLPCNTVARITLSFGSEDNHTLPGRIRHYRHGIDLPFGPDPISAGKALTAAVSLSMMLYP